jgi:hypothetical protein
MTMNKVLVLAVVLALGWAFVAAACISSIATVPASLASISKPRTAPAQVVESPLLAQSNGER